MSGPYAGGSAADGSRADGRPDMSWLDFNHEGSVEDDHNRLPHDHPGNAAPYTRAIDTGNTSPSGAMPGAYPTYSPVFRDRSDVDLARQQLPPVEKSRSKDSPGMLVPPGDRSRGNGNANGSRRPSGSRTCAKCGEPLQGQFVRALEGTYHLECFTCHVSSPSIVKVSV